MMLYPDGTELGNTGSLVGLDLHMPENRVETAIGTSELKRDYG